MQLLKIATAATVKLGPFVSATDGVTAETGLTISQADIMLSKNGGAFAQTNDATGATHDENGYYDVPLDTTDTDTVGRLRVSVSVAGALPVWQDFMVVPANVYDSLVLGHDYLDVRAQENADKYGYGLADNAITAAKIATGAIDADAIAADAVTKVQAGLSTLTAQDVADAAKLAPSAGAADPNSLRARVDVCVSQSNSAAVSSGMINSRLPANPAAVGSAMTLAPDQAVNVTKVAGSAVTGVDDFKADVSGLALESTLTAMKGAGWTDETLKKISDGVASNASYIASLHDFNPATETVTVGTNNDKTGYSLSTAGVQAIWDFAVASIAAAGSIGKRIVDYLTGDIYARLGAPTGASIAADIATRATPAQVNAECAAALADYDPPTKAEMDAGFDGISVTLTPEDITAIASAVSIDPQDLRDALKLAPSAGAAAPGSIDSQLEAIANRTQIPG